MTTLAVIRERRPGERRVALVPAELPKATGAGLDVAIEAGAGDRAGFADDAYRAVDGVRVLGTRQEVLAGASLLVTVSPPTVEEVDELPTGATLVSLLPPAWNVDVIARLRDRSIAAFSFDLMPRTSRAQAMDALSSQASLAGYQAVLVAADRLGRVFPVMMTAAGTVPPARVLVMGAGVAGLQAIATARRLGAAVTSYDVRPEAAEEVRSLGATFLDLPIEAQHGEGGYAAAQNAEFLVRQQELIAETVAQSDVVITTAAVPGRHAPRLVSTAMIEGMRPGSVVVDLAAAAGGNAELTVDGEEVDHGGVFIIGASDLPSGVATTASSLYARNVTNLLALLVHDGEIRPDFDDDIVAAICITTGGVIRHTPTRDLLGGDGLMTGSSLDLLVVFVLAAFVGFEVISKVPSILHTPLMSGSNAIHGIILVGAMIVASEAHGALQIILALAAVILSTLNIVGGVVVTDRMLEMFKGRERARPPRSEAPAKGERGSDDKGAAA